MKNKILQTVENTTQISGNRQEAQNSLQMVPRGIFNVTQHTL